MQLLMPMLMLLFILDAGTCIGASELVSSFELTGEGFGTPAQSDPQNLAAECDRLDSFYEAQRAVKSAALTIHPLPRPAPFASPQRPTEPRAFNCRWQRQYFCLLRS